MKRVLQIFALLLFAGFIVLQFFRPDFTNPPVNEPENLLASPDIPENVSAILSRSCKDCHSNETAFPWYSKIQPSAWFLAGHIEDGRRELNFSVWNTYEVRRKRRKLDEICEQIEERLMPLPSYLWIHRSAALSVEEIKILCGWARTESERLAKMPPGENN